MLKYKFWIPKILFYILKVTMIVVEKVVELENIQIRERSTGENPTRT